MDTEKKQKSVESSDLEESKWYLNPRFSDIRPDGFVEVLCEHGIGHHKGVHGCDGCCADVPDHIWEQVTNDKSERE